MLKPALIGGVLLGILSAVPVVSMGNCLCCAWVIGGGMVASYFFVKDSPISVTMGRGAGLGLLTGVIGTVVYALFFVPLFFLMNRAGIGPLDQIRQALDEAMRQTSGMPPESRQAFESLLSQQNLGVLFIVIGLFFSLVINCLFAMLGGILGVAIFEKRKRGAAPPQAPYYPPPSSLPPPPPPEAQ